MVSEIFKDRLTNERNNVQGGLLWTPSSKPKVQNKNKNWKHYKKCVTYGLRLLINRMLPLYLGNCCFFSTTTFIVRYTISIKTTKGLRLLTYTSLCQLWYFCQVLHASQMLTFSIFVQLEFLNEKKNIHLISNSLIDFK